MSEKWAWKDFVYEDTKNMSFEEKRKYLDRSLNEALSLLDAELQANSDGSHSIVVLK
jgi:hypothetical protein